MFKFLNNNLIAIFFSFSVLVLLSAYFIEHVLGYEACKLCLIGRLPYFSVIVLSLFFLFFHKFKKILLILIFMSFISSVLISFYHFGVEQGFFNESLVCDLSNSNKATSAQDLLKQLEKKTVSCKDVTFKLFGLSLATFNTIISLILSAIMFKIAINYDKNK